MDWSRSWPSLIVPAWCRACGRRVATEVDHVISLGMGRSRYAAGEPLNALGNLASLCAADHAAKTAGRRA